GHLQGLADGTYTVYAWRSGYLPAKVPATVSENTGSLTVSLAAGQVATATLTSTPLTYDQIIAAGIDPTSPDNQNVVPFTAELALGTNRLQASGYTAAGLTGSGGFPVCPHVAGVPVSCGAGSASFAADGYNVSFSVNYAHNQPELVWLVIPGKASWLKEFFN